ncbi:lipid scramblase CLPTM1L-like isoform X2 [Eriocheir sinensis]|uniref:lipid scramblase CLPTM1L-like isoform X2 n=1 Tax=Eriocheir sinensis TaxID=95602 RepID=UPI0021C88AA4|nr:lipid scramblase CLPTM1L-like isoform X2 [Eriocheir sinensis]
MLEGYRLPSLTTVVCGLFVAYILQSLWTLGQLFVHPSCPAPSDCYQPLIAQKPSLQLLAYTSPYRSPSRPNDLELLHRLNPFPYDEPREDVLEVSLPLHVRKNGSLFLHLFLTPPHIDPEGWYELDRWEHSVYSFAPLTQYHVPEASTFNLLGEDMNKGKDTKKDSSKPKTSSNKQEEKQKTQKAVTHFQSQVTFNILTDPVGLPKHDLPYDLGHALRLDSRGRYLPILHVDSLSARIRDLVEVTPTLKRTNLTLKYAPVSYGKLRLWMQFEGALRPMASLGFSAKDLDEVKGVFSDTSLYFLFVTFLVAALHMLFDFLAFKNDIAFWRGRTSMAGLSPSYVAWRAISQAIVFLYLLEENTSMLVLVPAGVGGIIELWKVTKAFHIRLEGWRLKVEHSITSGESATRALDSQGIRYLSYLLYPLLVCGAVYSLLYTPHRSWYSWLINSLVNGVYAFGFLFMLPQLFINYKLKSVAHLPWKTFMYKAFNTFIDDLFAFVITMPTAHRVACFRDDVVFLIYLFQRWLYPVDKSRVNEFGETGEEATQKEKKE